MNFEEIDKDNPLFPILLSFRRQKERMLENLALYLPETNKRYFHVPFFAVDDVYAAAANSTIYTYTAVYDKFAKEFINIRDILDNIIIDLRIKTDKKKSGGKGAIGI